MYVRPVVALAVVAGVLAAATAGVLVESVTTATSPSDGSPNRSAAVEPPPIEPSGAVACPPAAGASTGSRTVEEPALVELYPNPTTENDVGEFAVLETSVETAVGNWTLTDGYATASFPNETVDGRVALTIDADATAELTDEEPLELEGHLRLANDGDALELRDGDEVIDAVSYESAPLAEVWYRSDESPVEHGTGDLTAANEIDDRTNASERLDEPVDGAWWPREATCVPPVAGDATDATAFVLPDAPAVALETIRDADDRLLLAGYTFTSERVATELVEAADRSVDVRVLVESRPVGGTPAGADPVLAELEAGGVDVRAIGGEGARYDVHHPKYAVADDAVLVATENWKPSGLGGEGSRGWGVALEDPELAAALAAVFRADFEGSDTEPSDRYRERTTFVEEEGRPAREYPVEYEPENVTVESTELLVAPDNAENRLVELLAGAEEELLVKQASLGGTDVSLVEAAVEAARRGVDVRILLDSSWYVAEENRAIAAELERTAREENLPLEAELVDPDGRFEKIHAKGVVIDGETAVVGSANWNDAALGNNREVLVVLHGEEAAAYYAAVFEGDWDGEAWPLPFGLGVGVVAALLAAAFVGHRYVTFGDDDPRLRGGRDGGESLSAGGPGERRSVGPNDSSAGPGSLGGDPITVVPVESAESTPMGEPDTPSSGGEFESENR